VGNQLRVHDLEENDPGPDGYFAWQPVGPLEEGLTESGVDWVVYDPEGAVHSAGPRRTDVSEAVLWSCA
jgi:hypothetical protein